MKNYLLTALGAVAVLAISPLAISPAEAFLFGSQCPQQAVAAPHGQPACPVAQPRRHAKPKPKPQRDVTVVAPAPRTPVVVHPGPGYAPAVIEYGDPYVMQAARDGCPLVFDAVGPLKIHPNGHEQYRWRGSDWAFLPPKPAPDARVCTRNGHLAWWTPPRAAGMAPAGPDQSAPGEMAPPDQGPPALQRKGMRDHRQGPAPRDSRVVYMPRM